jgi:hypothetical protein
MDIVYIFEEMLYFLKTQHTVHDSKLDTLAGIIGEYFSINLFLFSAVQASMCNIEN